MNNGHLDKVIYEKLIAWNNHLINMMGTKSDVLNKCCFSQMVIDALAFHDKFSSPSSIIQMSLGESLNQSSSI